MGSPLDDLRKVTNQVNRKKIESERNMQTIQKNERDKLSRKSFDQQQKRKEEAEEVAKRTKKIKNRVMLALASLVICILFFVSLYVHSTLTDSNGPVELISDNSKIYDNGTNYTEIVSFTQGVTEQENSDKNLTTKSQWYKGLSADKIAKFKDTIKRKTSTSDMTTKEVKYDEDKEVFEVHSESEDSELIIRIICDENNNFKIIKVL